MHCSDILSSSNQIKCCAVRCLVSTTKRFYAVTNLSWANHKGCTVLTCLSSANHESCLCSTNQNRCSAVTNLSSANHKGCTVLTCLSSANHESCLCSANQKRCSALIYFSSANQGKSTALTFSLQPIRGDALLQDVSFQQLRIGYLLLQTTLQPIRKEALFLHSFFSQSEKMLCCKMPLFNNSE